MAQIDRRLAYLLGEIYGLKQKVAYSRLEVSGIEGELYRVACHCFIGYILIIDGENIPDTFKKISYTHIQVKETMEKLKNKKVYFFNNELGRSFFETYVPQVIDFLVNRNARRYRLTEDQKEGIRRISASEREMYYQPDKEKEAIETEDIQCYLCV